MMEHVPKRIQITIEPWLYSHKDESESLELFMEVRVNDNIISNRKAI